MKIRLRHGLAAAAIVATAGLAGTAGSASAAHCTDSGGPGNSDFADHVQATTAPGGHNEGDHRGWSSCIEGNPNYTG